jgi:Phosphate-induced protein 1 conserved region
MSICFDCNGLFILKNSITINVFLVLYIIWYGTWTQSAKTIIQNFVSNLGGTPFWAINNAYGVGNIVYKGDIDDSGYSQGTNLTTPWNVVQNAFDKALLPQDTNAIYLVLSSR